MKIQKIMTLFANLSPLKVNNTLCSREITPKSSCQKCVEVCPTQGLSFENGVLQLEECIYCGFCVSACPNHVFKLNEDHLINQCSTEKTLIITCHPFQKKLKLKDKEKDKLVSINCLSQLYPELVINLLFNSKEVVIFLNPALCNNCLKFKVSNLMAELNAFNLFTNAVHLVENIVDLQPYLDKIKDHSNSEEIQNYNRRMFLKSIFSSAQKIPRQFFSSTNTDNNKPRPDRPKNEKMVKVKRKYLYDIFKNTLDLKAVDLSKSLPYKKLQITECNFCEVCTKLCPTSALQVIKSENKKSLVFIPHLCTECNICQDVCFFQGIKWSENLSIKDFIQTEPLVLISASKNNCLNCQQEFWQIPGKKTICTLCGK
ncbi:formate hydrogenlyase subunit 6/NADH:ubiquinone oxidoreductase subunit I [Desulfohalotomaculum tongense]|uniref:4Fe-4S binding protein n=1 Tax=Desulforadius tongensis TaxID=1216062 RepID=UPI00195611C6|nr:4Fe-4S binding protein [Desulforadius tongensis]MBM7854105.1 formate hydrogenlyase subunit 6/NADH:ubiquinone oxidoreductase subunit I [Desulforadius tongensis]